MTDLRVGKRVIAPHCGQTSLFGQTPLFGQTMKSGRHCASTISMNSWRSPRCPLQSSKRLSNPLRDVYLDCLGAADAKSLAC